MQHFLKTLIAVMAFTLVIPALADKAEKTPKKGIHDFRFADGRMYSGNWLDHMPSGPGKMIMPTGESFEGTWVMGQMQGEGIMMRANGDVIKGSFTNTQPTGRCIMECANGDYYEGYLSNFTMNGQGKLIQSDGTKYEGTFVNGKLTGRGTYRNTDGETYDGLFADGKYHGEGTLTTRSGDRYEGEFTEGLPCGRINARYKDGSTFEGTIDVNGRRTGVLREGTDDDYTIMEITNNLPQGDLKRYVKSDEGTIISTGYKDGDKFITKELTSPEGMYIKFIPPYTPDVQGRQNAVITYKDFTYEGQVDADTGIFNGQGLLKKTNNSYLKGTFKDGELWEGEYVNYRDKNSNVLNGSVSEGKMNGEGRKDWSDGGVFIGTFKDGDTWDGQCTDVRYYKDGDYVSSYTGPLKGNKFNGQGTMTWLNGDKYVGQWANDNMNGQGTRTYGPGQVWIRATGTFIDGQHRQGTLVRTNGTFHGYWDEDGTYLGR